MFGWEDAVAFALSLPETERGTHYGQDAVKVTSNGRAFLNVGHEPATSFVLALDLDTIELLKETDPASFWQSPHYQGWPAVLCRYDAPDPDRVRAMIAQSRDWTAARPKTRARKPT
ncbi:MAG: MmcQ/YjbR family DNA-binding protein [Sphingomonas sp.]